jgi:GNAT superfamily N-acetyltransferase
MLTIKPLTLNDIPGARRLSDAAGWNQLDVDWERLIALWPATTLAGWLDGELIATASLAYFDPVPGGINRLAWIGVMLVAPARRGGGLGSKMFDAALQCGADRGIVDYGLDATDMGRPVYVKRGFVDRFGMNRWKCDVPRASFESKIPTRPLVPADWDQVIALDQRATRVNRKILLQRLAQESSAHAVVCEQAGKIVGFGMLRPGRVAAYIGPIVAEDVKLAGAICVALIAAHNRPDFPLFIDVGAGNAIEPHLRASGFTVARQLIRMGRAAVQCPLAYNPETFAIAGLELC